MFKNKKSMNKKSHLPSKYVDLLPYVSCSPDQHQGRWGTGSYVNSGSCHHMACTGAMEMILNKAKGVKNPKPGGDTDLSERWMMNIKMPNGGCMRKKRNYCWISDRAMVYNYYGRTMLEKDYPYTKGLYGNKFSVKYNWENDLPKNWEMKSIEVPKIQNKRLFGKFKDSSVYDVAVLDESHINKIKEALVKYDAPVLVVYNGEEVWHSVLIVGYDDDIYIGDCPYVKEMIREEELSEKHLKQLKKEIKKQGFRKYGVFYVRLVWSILCFKQQKRESEYYKYPRGFYGKSEYLYDYGLKDIENKDRHWQPYVAPYCKRSYDWMKYLGNHAVVIYPDPQYTKNLRSF